MRNDFQIPQNYIFIGDVNSVLTK